MSWNSGNAETVWKIPSFEDIAQWVILEQNAIIVRKYKKAVRILLL